MSDREFDNYLALLGGLLGLSAKQRAEIAGELRDHLEQRLADLTASGLPRHEAVERALAEFGDAASLAAAFLNVSRTRRKRWIMKWTAASIGGLAVAALLAVAMWPEGANVKLTPKAVAQTPAGQASSGLTPPGGVAAGAADVKKEEANKEEVKTREDNNARTEAALSNQVAAEFLESPLFDVIEYLGDVTDVQFYVNWKKLDEEGVMKDAPITIGLAKVRVDMLLDLALAQAGDNAAYVLRDGIVIVSSAGDLENATEVRVYNCRDLLAIGPPGSGRRFMGMGGMISGGGDSSGPGAAGPATPGAGAMPPGGSGGASGGAMGSMMGGIGYGGPVDEASARVGQLMQVVTTAVAPDSWQNEGGFGTVSEFSGMLVVNHNARTHRQIEKVLSMLREAVAKDGATKGTPGSMMMPGGSRAR